METCTDCGRQLTIGPTGQCHQCEALYLPLETVTAYPTTEAAIMQQARAECAADKAAFKARFH